MEGLSYGCHVSLYPKCPTFTKYSSRIIGTWN